MTETHKDLGGKIYLLFEIQHANSRTRQVVRLAESAPWPPPGQEPRFAFRTQSLKNQVICVDERCDAQQLMVPASEWRSIRAPVIWIESGDQKGAESVVAD